MRTFCSLWLIVGSGISMIHSLILISGFTCKTFVKCLIPIAPIVSTFDAFSFTAAFGSALVYFFVPVKLAWTAWEEQCKSCRYNSTGDCSLCFFNLNSSSVSDLTTNHQFLFFDHHRVWNTSKAVLYCPCFNCEDWP
ncbi:Hypothetical predicted protein [Cloeon dipterum]|uniref:Uncharacterized protein n=1 Tax=Cloeon dipterum TaxID=197152 RepID=A0A8S1D482_9INSE|nr:Hypothetical predicted protein [Cloeon dipterum]